MQKPRWVSCLRHQEVWSAERTTRSITRLEQSPTSTTKATITKRMRSCRKDFHLTFLIGISGEIESRLHAMTGTEPTTIPIQWSTQTSTLVRHVC